MKKAKGFVWLIVCLFKYVLSFLFLVFKTILKELSIVLPYENFEYKNIDNSRLCCFKAHTAVISILIGIFLACCFNLITKYSLMTLDILFFFYILILFIYQTYSKYLSTVN